MFCNKDVRYNFIQSTVNHNCILQIMLTILSNLIASIMDANKITTKPEITEAE